MDAVDKGFQEFYLLVRKNRYKAALALLYDAKTNKINRPFNSDPNHAWYCIGDVYFKRGEYGSAVVAFKKALRTREDDSDALWAVADCYSEMHKPRLAERYLRRALAYEANNKNLVYNLANALFDQGRYEEALTEYKRIGRSQTDLYELARKNIAVIVNMPRVGRTSARRMR